jgi:hypothetical protein
MALGKIKLSHAQLLVLFWKESCHGVAILGENHVLIWSKIYCTSGCRLHYAQKGKGKIHAIDQ